MFSTTDPQFHGARRRLLASPISDSSLSHLVPQISNRVEYTIQRIAEEINNRGAADIFKWWLFMATDIIGELSFGESFKMLEAGKVSSNIHSSRANLDPLPTSKFKADAIFHGPGKNI